ncbi:MAG: alpha/beta hydrolase, partial [Rubrivivax sp.]
ALGLMRHLLPKALLRMNLKPAYGNPDFHTDALTTRYHDLMLAPGARDAMLLRLQQTTLTDPVPVLARLRAPTLLLWGEADAMIPFANAKDYQQAMPGSRLVSFAGVGHLPQEEAAEASLQAVQAFLR